MDTHVTPNDVTVEDGEYVVKVYHTQAGRFGLSILRRGEDNRGLLMFEGNAMGLYAQFLRIRSNEDLFSINFPNGPKDPLTLEIYGRSNVISTIEFSKTTKVSTVVNGTIHKSEGGLLISEEVIPSE